MVADDIPAKSSAVKKKQRNLKKKRMAKKKKQQKNKPEAAVDLRIYSRQRNFKEDVREYIDAWSNREIDPSGWKFNKVLQTWMLAHVLDEAVIDKDLFKDLCPYIASVTGGARDRLQTSLNEAIQKALESAGGALIDQTEEQVAAGEAIEAAAKRARKLLKLFP
jgi:hypothetical protein